MAPDGIFLFPEMQLNFKGKMFDDEETTEHTAMKQILAVLETDPEKCF
jgi:hypothetical protein